MLNQVRVRDCLFGVNMPYIQARVQVDWRKKGRHVQFSSVYFIFQLNNIIIQKSLDKWRVDQKRAKLVHVLATRKKGKKKIFNYYVLRQRQHILQDYRVCKQDQTRQVRQTKYVGR